MSGPTGTYSKIAQDAATYDGLGNPHRYAGVSYFWITCRYGMLSGNLVITCWALKK